MRRMIWCRIRNSLRPTCLTRHPRRPTNYRRPSLRRIHHLTHRRTLRLIHRRTLHLIHRRMVCARIITTRAGRGLDNSMRLVCLVAQLTGAYGTVVAGQQFECEPEIALQLLAAGFVRRVGPTAVQYETKVIVPEAPEVSARPGFRHLSVPHAKPEGVASASDTVLPASGGKKRGAADPVGRHRRAGSRSG